MVRKLISVLIIPLETFTSISTYFKCDKQSSVKTVNKNFYTINDCLSHLENKLIFYPCISKVVIHDPMLKIHTKLLKKLTEYLFTCEEELMMVHVQSLYHMPIKEQRKISFAAGDLYLPLSLPLDQTYQETCHRYR